MKLLEFEFRHPPVILQNLLHSALLRDNQEAQFTFTGSLVELNLEN